MPSSHPVVKTVPDATLAQLNEFDTCSLSNAIERFQVRTRNEGFTDGSVRCIFPHVPPVIGYAVTARIRSSSTPIAGRCYYDRADWWSYVRSIPAPRFIVAQDVDDKPGLGALFGEVHANISRALDCSAYMTNGAVRDLPGIEATGLQVFAGNIAVSHAYAHIVEFGKPVEVGGLQITPGDLLHGDRHGVLSIPLSIAQDLPKKVTQILALEKQLIDFCHSQDFSFDKLTEKIALVSNQLGEPDKDLK